jgi:DNA-binding response OmpR family regulator
VEKEDRVREQGLSTILCVDEDEADRHAFARALREAGFEVKEAATGEEALALAGQKPALVLLAVNRPDAGGLEVCRRIKADPATTAVPVLCLFGVDVPAAGVSRAREEGAAGCLTKSVDPRELIAQARALLGGQTAQSLGNSGQGGPTPDPFCRSGLTKREAEKLLDWLEANGYRHRELAHKEGEGFIVRWQPCPREEGGENR